MNIAALRGLVKLPNLTRLRKIPRNRVVPQRARTMMAIAYRVALAKI